MSIIIPANSAVGGGDQGNSCRFSSGSSDSLTRTPSSASNRKTWTWSSWVKRSVLTSGDQSIFNSHTDAQNQLELYFNSDDSLYVTNRISNTGANLRTNAKFKDPSAWYHIVLAVDTTQGTDTNRMKLYVNGVQVTSFSETGYPGVNTDTAVNNTVQHRIGDSNLEAFFSGYIAEAVLIDGQQLAPTSFGEFDSDSGIWKPIDVSGLTFGTNGFYLDFKDSSALGADVSGNSNNYTVNNLVANNQTTDTPTNNFATVNSLDNFYEASTFSEGNLKIVTESGDYSYNTSTIGLSSGKWYCEVFVESSPTGNASIIGIAGRMSEASLGFLGGYLDTYGFYGANGNMYNIGGNGVTSYGSGYGVNSVIGIYMDLDNNKLYFAINGSIQNSGTGYTILAPNLTKAGFYFPAAADNYNGSSGTFRLNFGNPIYALTSANTDVNGYGSFEYDPSSGTFDGASKDFLAICTKNLSEVNS